MKIWKIIKIIHKIIVKSLDILNIFHIFVIRNKEVTMKAILGQYYYAPHRRSYGVWQWDWVSEKGASGRFVKDFCTKEEAREYVWAMNGWGKPKTKLN